MTEKWEITVLGSEDTVTGFGLIGISGNVVNDAKSARNFLETFAKSRQYKIIIINRRLIEGIEEYIKNYRLNPENPIVVDIPDESGISVFESVKDIIKKSIGI